MRMLSRLSALLPVCAVLSGCAAVRAPAPAVQTRTTLAGVVHGGQQPIAGSSLTIFAAGTAGYGSAATALTTATSNASGDFSIAAPDCTAVGAHATLYILAAGGDSGFGTNPNIMLGAALGPCGAGLPANIAINEVTTSALAFAMGQFFTTSLGGASTDSFGAPAGVALPLANAAAHTVPLLVNPSNGQANASVSTPTLTTTVDSAKLNSIANTLAACVNTAGLGGASQNCATLFADTTPPGTAIPPPVNTLEAAVQMSLYPYQHVAALYGLAAGAGAPYIGLATAPNDWTLGVAYTSPAYGLSIAGTGAAAGSAAIDIDSSGNVWFATNTASAHGLAMWDVAAGVFAGPYAVGLIAPQYVAIDNGGIVFGNDGVTGQVLGVSAASPTVAAAMTLTPGSSATGPLTVSPAYSGAQITGYGLSTVALTPMSATVMSFVGSAFVSSAPAAGMMTGLASTEADASQTIVDTAGTGPGSPCVLGQAVSNNSFSPSLQSGSPCQSGGVLHTFNSLDTMMTVFINGSVSQICSSRAASCFLPPVPLNHPEAAAIDGDSHIWVANAGDASVSTFAYNRGAQGTQADYMQTSPVPYPHGSSNGGTFSTPYGLAIDGAGNVWVANAGCAAAVSACTAPGSFTLSELIGAAAPTRTPLSAQNGSATSGNTTGTRP